MIASIYQIDFINEAGTNRLMDYGDGLAEEIRFEVAQEAAKYSPIGSEWGETEAGLSAYVSLAWQRRQDHASHTAARNHCLRTAAATTLRQSGILRVSIQNGDSWEIADCTLTASSPIPLVGYGFRTLTGYQAIGGRMTPISVELHAGIPWNWTLQNFETVSNQWQTL